MKSQASTLIQRQSAEILHFELRIYFLSCRSIQVKFPSAKAFVRHLVVIVQFRCFRTSDERVALGYPLHPPLSLGYAGLA